RELEERRNLLGRLRADAEPVLGTLGVDLDERGLLGRVVLADLLDHTTVALGARVGDDDAVVRRADLAQALQANLYSHNSPVFLDMGANSQPCAWGDTRPERSSGSRGRLVRGADDAGPTV